MNIGEKVHKIKCENKADAEKYFLKIFSSFCIEILILYLKHSYRWIKGINDWRDYLILKMV